MDPRAKRSAARASERVLPVGLRTGDGVFETVRTYSGVPFLLDRHVERLRRGARSIGLRSIPSSAAVTRACAEALARFRSAAVAREAVVRPMLFASSGGSELWVPVEPLVPTFLEGKPEGVRVGLSSYRHPGRFLVPPGSATPVKWLARGPLSHALREARARGWVEAILPDDDDRLIEGTRSNLLAVVDGGLIAPGSESYALPGITRGVALEEARALGLAVEERAIGREELPEVTELLLTSSLMGIVSVAWVERAWSRTGASRAPVGSRLRRSYAARVRAQVRSFRR